LKLDLKFVYRLELITRSCSFGCLFIFLGFYQINSVDKQVQPFFVLK